MEACLNDGAGAGGARAPGSDLTGPSLGH